MLHHSQNYCAGLQTVLLKHHYRQYEFLFSYKTLAMILVLGLVVFQLNSKICRPVQISREEFLVLNPLPVILFQFSPT